ncbi:amino acid ABC transporter substrate-binding protein [Aneurinibacillus aneurinilyticus]|jgi:polar amino acid transport system substrate-binding protein|uniref:ABC transporter, substrate-binding protein, family 3 n=1 Tax=Aneurinibacillus aneurinilyticus ATCC 12856 TaxID=649747 RepID=U1X433_ANEAE|nr:amino acid ABC transporter substrate-binding protein [Aneurinibacillus aneurinilyticus]ERI09740.1 ABC transporter, substrate-binding protein, family 3 [Aneurinibacillus aneurinilyticus ATCC 12856]MCI1694984.1 amino acid ABC transporter substrate-binding protein [Aneurinibacillus aneurinilyticus]MED0707155.1 amino acid ABC transporter substrate-binding protein [Aneurinibacillus aneurinilyticus]MED0723457.1 amino acid ABC transporter substrate-binding protein [Aneurinibacillus aneurinilyticus]
MKKFVAMFFALAMIISIMAGCSSASSSGTNKKLVIGVDDQFAPMGFRDDKNELAGFDIDYARAAGEKMGYEVVFQPIDWNAKESELSSGRIDLIWNGYTITDKRKRQVLFTKPYLKNAQVVVTLEKANISKLDDLTGKNIGLQSSSSAEKALDGNPIKSKIKNVSKYKDNVIALSDLKIGRTDAVVIDEVVARYYMSKEKDTFKILDESLAPEEYGVGVKKGNEKLLNELQKALDEINKDGTAAKISKKWFGEDKVLK